MSNEKCFQNRKTPVCKGRKQVYNLFQNNRNMARKYCYCTSNLFCAKILGALGIIAVIINFALWTLAVIGTQSFHPSFVLPLIIYWTSLLANICLIVGTVQHRRSLLCVWMCLSMISVLLYFVVFILACANGDHVYIASYLVSILLTLCSFLIVFGAYQELSEIHDIFQYFLFFIPLGL